MKEKGSKPDAPEIILNDEEARQIIQSLIKVACDKDYKRNDLLKAIIHEWKATVPVPVPEYKFTDDERAFAKKVDQLFEEYGREILSVYDSVSRYDHLKCGNKPDVIEHMTKHFKILLCAAYCNFCRNDSITREDIRIYAVKLMGTKANYWASNDDVKTLNELFYHFSYTMGNNERPIFCKDVSIIPSKNHLSFNKDYTEFMDKFVYTNRDLVKGVLSAIWFIQTYY